MPNPLPDIIRLRRLLIDESKLHIGNHSWAISQHNRSYYSLAEGHHNRRKIGGLAGGVLKLLI